MVKRFPNLQNLFKVASLFGGNPLEGSITAQGLWIESYVLEKLPLEESVILVADSMADLIDGKIGFQNELLGRFHPSVDEVLNGWFAVLLGENAAELG